VEWSKILRFKVGTSWQ